MKTLGCAIVAAVSTFSAAAAPARAAQNACEREMVRAASAYGVPLGVLYAVGRTESGRGDSMRPNALNIEGRTVYDLERGAAVEVFHAAQASGKKLIDVGCMQINYHYHGHNFDKVEDMFDPARNVDYAAKFLRQLREREGSWTMAVARYYAGPNNDPAQQRYVCRVIANMVASGFGAWTAAARKLCQPQAVAGE
jgi:soluble lytic murein transglycosylase-like protein